MAVDDILESYFESEPLGQIALDISIRLTTSEVFELIDYLEKFQKTKLNKKKEGN